MSKSSCLSNFFESKSFIQACLSDLLYYSGTWSTAPANIGQAAPRIWSGMPFRARLFNALKSTFSF